MLLPLLYNTGDGADDDVDVDAVAWRCWMLCMLLVIAIEGNCWLLLFATRLLSISIFPLSSIDEGFPEDLRRCATILV